MTEHQAIALHIMFRKLFIFSILTLLAISILGPIGIAFANLCNDSDGFQLAKARLAIAETVTGEIYERPRCRIGRNS